MSINSRNKISKIVVGTQARKYKKKNGSWHIARIAEDANLHRNTVSRHLEEMGLNFSKTKKGYM